MTDAPAATLSIVLSQMTQSVGDLAANVDAMRTVRARHQDADLILYPQPQEIVAEWEDNLAEAERRGIFGTPTYVVGDELFWGQDRLDFVERALSEAGAHKESA